MSGACQKILFVLFPVLAVMSCTKERDTVFQLLPSSSTGIHFNNLLDEDEQNNVNTYMNIYTGGGVSAGDINNDGLVDLFFSGNMVSSRLYLNKGDLTFEDITESSGILNDSWATGSVMADVNQDGWLDIYQCVSGSGDNKTNLLFINNGNSTFTESAAEYGVSEKRQSMHASFFDYDRDNDLDLFIITNPASYENQVNNIQPRKLDGESASTDVLYRNNGDHTFTDVSREAGILVEGYSLGLAISDINIDGWPDIYISNDFIGNDILYINNRDGTFTNRAAGYFKHTSFAGMGNDIADINNDGLVDVIELDMRPEDNERQKLIIPPTGYDKFQLSLRVGYEPQFSRNTLQLNQGNGKFSEIAFLAGVSSTDWSWSPLLADYDNDGDRDLFATNGFLRDLGNMDYITYQNIYNTPLGTVQAKTDKKLNAIKSLEGAVLRNYLFENNGDLTFTNQSEAWGIHLKGISHGAAYADLDNDGDLDLAINNMNEEAHIYRNNSRALLRRNYLRVDFAGNEPNRDGIGAKVSLFYHGRRQYAEHFLNRGYESTVDGILHFGLDTVTVVDSVEVIWPDESYELLRDVGANQTLLLQQTKARGKSEPAGSPSKSTVFSANSGCGIDYVHRENDFVDFKIQPLLPHMHSRNGPGIAVADVNGDGLEDIFIGAAAGYPGGMFLQSTAGQFTKGGSLPVNTPADIMGVLFFDADLDGDADLYVATGGSEHPAGSDLYHDQLYINDGSGNFTLQTSALPDITQSGSAVSAADYDRDGDLDLFIGGRIIPGRYPMPASSYILRNDSRMGYCKFTDVTPDIAPALQNSGLVTSALWTDVDNDGWTDLMVTGEFMPITCYRNDGGTSFVPFGEDSFVHTTGWWNSLTAADFDHDGDIDYIAGNLGLNTRYRGNAGEPVCIYAKDYDKNGSLDPVMTYYLQGKKQLVHARDELISQISAMRLRFRKYKDYSDATFETSFLPSELDSAYSVCAERFETSYIENNGKGKFSITALPLQAQFAPVYGVVTGDYDLDGNEDVMITGNLYSAEVNTGQYDASVGLYLRGNGRGGFDPVTPILSGFVSDGDAKGMVKIKNSDGRNLIVVGNNSGPAGVYTAGSRHGSYSAGSEDAYALLTLRNGRIYKHEFYYGSSYLSQSSRSVDYSSDVVKIVVVDAKGQPREIPLR